VNMHFAVFQSVYEKIRRPSVVGIRRAAIPVVLLVTLVAGLLVAGCTDAGVGEGPLAEAWMEDINYLQEELPKRHANLFFRITEDEWNAMLEDLKKDLPDLTEDQIKIRLKQAIAAVGDDHTTMVAFHLGGPYMVYPVQLWWFSDGLRVMGTDPDHSAVLGARVQAIEGRPLGEVWEAVTTVIPHENEHWLRTHVYVCALPEVMGSLGLVEGDTMEMTVESLDGQELEISLTPQEYSEVAWVGALKEETMSEVLWLKSNEPYWFEYIPEEKLLYFQYNRCYDAASTDQAGGETPGFTKFSSQLLQALEDNEVERFVIDLRRNSGGDSRVAKTLLERIATLSVNQRGNLFVMVGRRTYSSAVIHTVQLKSWTEALFFGEPTGGKPDSYGNVKSFELPNSKVVVRYSTDYYNLTGHFNIHLEDESTFTPDFIIPFTYADYVQGIDPVLEAILEYEDTGE